MIGCSTQGVFLGGRITYFHQVLLDVLRVPLSPLANLNFCFIQGVFLLCALCSWHRFKDLVFMVCLSSIQLLPAADVSILLAPCWSDVHLTPAQNLSKFSWCSEFLSLASCSNRLLKRHMRLWGVKRRICVKTHSKHVCLWHYSSSRLHKLFPVVLPPSVWACIMLCKAVVHPLGLHVLARCTCLVSNA